MVLDSSIFNKAQFPWLEENDVLFSPEKSYPKVSIVVPSFNQGDFLEETLRSILQQKYPALELIVIDGGSTDRSVEIIQKYQEQIAYWVSEKDFGQSHAINKGFEKATGEWIAWMNSDDCYLKGALHFVFDQLPHQQYDFLFGNCSPGTSMDSRRYRHVTRNHRDSIFKLLLFFHSTQYMIPSQSVFVRRELLQTAGFLDQNCHYVMDMEWYVRIYKQTRKHLFYKRSICFYRINDTTKTGSAQAKMMKEAKEVARLYLSDLSWWQQVLLRRLMDESEGFGKEFNMFQGLDWNALLGILFRYPLSALSNTHFLAYVKNKILK